MKVHYVYIGAGIDWEKIFNENKELYDLIIFHHAKGNELNFYTIHCRANRSGEFRTAFVKFENSEGEREWHCYNHGGYILWQPLITYEELKKCLVDSLGGIEESGDIPIILVDKQE